MNVVDADVAEAEVALLVHSWLDIENPRYRGKGFGSSDRGDAIDTYLVRFHPAKLPPKSQSTVMKERKKERKKATLILIPANFFNMIASAAGVKSVGHGSLLLLRSVIVQRRQAGAGAGAGAQRANIVTRSTSPRSVPFDQVPL